MNRPLVQVSLDGILSFRSLNHISLVSSLNLMRVHSILSSVSLIKLLNNTGPDTDLCGTQLVTDVHWDSELLATALCMPIDWGLLVFFRRICVYG